MLDLYLNWHLNPGAFIPGVLGFTQILKAEKEDATHDTQVMYAAEVFPYFL